MGGIIFPSVAVLGLLRATGELADLLSMEGRLLIIRRVGGLAVSFRGDVGGVDVLRPIASIGVFDRQEAP